MEFSEIGRPGRLAWKTIKEGPETGTAGLGPSQKRPVASKLSVRRRRFS